MTCSLLEIYPFQPIFLLSLLFLSSTSSLPFQPVTSAASPTAANSSHLQPHKIHLVRSSWRRREFLTGSMLCRKPCQDALICIFCIFPKINAEKSLGWDKQVSNLSQCLSYKSSRTVAVLVCLVWSATRMFPIFLIRPWRCFINCLSSKGVECTCAPSSHTHPTEGPASSSDLLGLGNAANWR